MQNNFYMIKRNEEYPQVSVIRNSYGIQNFSESTEFSDKTQIIEFLLNLL